MTKKCRDCWLIQTIANDPHLTDVFLSSPKVQRLMKDILEFLLSKKKPNEEHKEV